MTIQANFKRIKIKKAARKLLLENGLYNVTLNDVAKTADVPLGNMYYYYKSKEALVKDVVPEFVNGTVKPNNDHEHRLALDIKLHKGKIR